MLSQQSSEDLYKSLRASIDSSVYSDFHATQAEEPLAKQENAAINLEEFDLLAGHDYGNTQVISAKHRHEETQKILVWQKLETTGYHPASRQAHTSVAQKSRMITFGGFEGGKRVNSTITLDLFGRSWTYNDCKGSLPTARSFHAACCINDLMIIHGGEGVKPSPVEPSPNESNNVESSLSIEQPNPSAPPRTVGKMKGVCPGDNLTEGKLKSAIKIKHANQSRHPPSQPSPMVNQTLPNGTVTPTASLLDTLSLSEAVGVVSCLEDMFALDTITYTWYSIPCALSPLARKGHTLNTCELSPISSSTNPYPGSEKVLTMIMFGGYSLENLTVSNSVFICEAPQVERCIHQLKQQQQLQQQEKQRLLLAQDPAAIGPGTTNAKQPKNSTGSQVEPIIWKSVACRGSAPSPRYRHSSCIVPGNSGECLLVIMGGIGKDPKVALSDVYILDIQNWTWITLAHGNDCLAQGLGGVGPAAGIYGHIAVPVAKITPKTPEELLNEANEDAVMDVVNPSYEMIIFGGSANTLSQHSNCYASMFALDLCQHQWRRIDTGHTFPSSRCNHSVAVIDQWSLTHNLSYQKTLSQRDQPQPQQTGIANTIAANTMATMASESRATAIIFGGVSATKGQADSWALDLQWKLAGIQQYDNNIEQLIQETIQQTNHYYQETLLASRTGDDPLYSPHTLQLGKSFSTSHLPPSSQKSRFQASNNKKYLQSYFTPASTTNTGRGTIGKQRLTKGSNSNTPMAGVTREETEEVMTEANSTFAGIPIVDEIYLPSGEEDYEALFLKNTNHRSIASPSGGRSGLLGKGKEKEVNELILKLRKERALTSIQLQQEKNENSLLNEKIHLLTDELNKTQQTMVTMKGQYEQEMKEMKKLLIESQRRENLLKQLHQETLQLLQLNGIDQITSPQTHFPFKEP